MRTFLAIVLVSAIAFAEAASASQNEEAIRQADKKCLEAVESRSLERTLEVYAPDAVTAGSAMFPAHGLADFRAGWTQVFADPGFALTWETDKVVVMESGSIAYSSGTWHNQNLHGAHLAVWQKQPNGLWKIIIDSAWVTP
jgi:ketosteroid isomerase-like protein